MKTGLPCHLTVSRWPTCTGPKSTSVVLSANVSLAGSMLSMSGHTATAAPTPATADAAIVRKSRRDAESEVCAPIGFGCAVSAIAPLSLTT